MVCSQRGNKMTPNEGKKRDTMKKSTRILLVIVLCLVLIAISLPGKLSFNSYQYDDASRYTAGDGKIRQKVKNIDISWVAGDVNIALHGGDEIILRETASRKLKTAEQMHWLLDGDTLYVKYVRSGKLFSSNLDKELTLLLPDGLKLDDVKVTCVSAQLEADLPETDSVRIESVSGPADVMLEKTENVRINTVSGDVVLRTAAAPDSVKMDAVSADLTIQLPGNAGFTADVDSVSGNISGDLLEGMGDVKEYTRGNGECSITMNSVSGDLHLDAYTR